MCGESLPGAATLRTGFGIRAALRRRTNCFRARPQECIVGDQRQLNVCIVPPAIPRLRRSAHPMGNCKKGSRRTEGRRLHKDSYVSCHTIWRPAIVFPVCCLRPVLPAHSSTLPSRLPFSQ